jgi:hypothetical protein
MEDVDAMQVCEYIAQWLERLTADRQVPGSNPGVPSEMLCCVPSHPTHKIFEDVVDTFLVIIWNLSLQSCYE